MPCLRRLKGTGTCDDVDELVRDGGLTTTVVFELQIRDHVASVLGGVVHGVAAKEYSEH